MHLFVKRSLWVSRDRGISGKIILSSRAGLIHANLPDRARWYPKMRPSGNQSVKRQPTPWWAFLSLIYDHLQGDSQMLLKRRPRS